MEGGLNIRGVELIETIRYISHPTEGYTQQQVSLS